MAQTITRVPARGMAQGLTHPVANGLRSLWKFARLKPLGAVGGTIIFFLVLISIFPDALARYDPLRIVGEPYTAPNSEFWWGTDNIGRDVYSRTIWGARLSMTVGLSATLISAIAALVIASVTAYYGGLADLLVQRLVDAFSSLPGLVLALFALTILAPSMMSIIIVLAVTAITGKLRTIRSAVLSIKEQPYVESARAIGCSTPRILMYYVFPQLSALFIIIVSLSIGGTIIAETSLSFLGLGLSADVPSWGNMVNRGIADIFTLGPWQAPPPGIFIALAVVGFNLLGDALRDVLDPRLRGSGVGLRRGRGDTTLEK